ncbi:hypothetical protein [Bacillus multifaciens]|uniref:hypothetical protein n=1 Tax=Bacillus multifaciens TaxID=3068506 RepID=UPI002741F2EA|nr:hypothetical protein [Bacillus sp. WLY-B-L8]MDP7978854.1 hypothetical protein [Bacillus sp. WLY-B-L8]
MVWVFVIIQSFTEHEDAIRKNLSYNKGNSKEILGGVDMAITMKLLDTAASHAKPSMEKAILCVR